MHKQSKNSNVRKEIETIWTFMLHMLEQFLGTAVEQGNQWDCQEVTLGAALQAELTLTQPSRRECTSYLKGAWKRASTLSSHLSLILSCLMEHNLGSTIIDSLSHVLPSWVKEWRFFSRCVLSSLTLSISRGVKRKCSMRSQTCQ